MQSRQAWLDDEVATAARPLTRRGVLAGSLKLAGAGALALGVAAGPAYSRLVLAQDEDDMATEGEGTDDAAADIQVGTTEDTAAAGAQGEGEAGAELPAAEGESDADREARRAAREAEGAVGAGAEVATVPRTGVGSVVGSSLGSAAGAIGLAAASAAAAILARRDAFRSGAVDE